MNTTNEAKPVRLQRSRKKGAKLVSPNGLQVVVCSRPGKWGNPYTPGKVGYVPGLGRIEIKDKAHAVEMFRRNVLDPIAGAVYRASVIDQLHGKNLACWCAIGDVCHVDTLLSIANPEPCRDAAEGEAPTPK